MKLKYLLKGLIKSIPGIEKLYNFHKHTGGATENARYCYSVWLRHMILAYKNGYSKIPVTILELGPGQGLGVGIAALLSGAQKYYGLDIIRYSNSKINIEILDEMVELFIKRTPLPDRSEFPYITPLLDDNSFPSHIITESIIENIKKGDIVWKVKEAIKDLDENKTNELIIYSAPWFDVKIDPGSIDMILSQAVLQHIDQIENTYEYLHTWLKPNGLLSCTIDFASMKSSDTWYGHWAYSDLEWKIVKGRKIFYINRLSLSNHLSLMKSNGFKILSIIKVVENDIINKDKLAKRFKELTDEDLQTSSIFLQAVNK